MNDKELFEKALDFCEQRWQTVPMDNCAFEKLREIISALQKRVNDPKDTK